MCDVEICAAHTFFFPLSLLLSSPLHTHKRFDYKFCRQIHVGFTQETRCKANMTEIKSLVFWRAVAAEFFGMLLFIFIALSAIIGNPVNIAQELKVSLAFALAIATLAQCLGHVSGAHLNPAVTLGLLVCCQISALRCIFYILAQMLGAVAASAIVYSFKNSGSIGVNTVRARPCDL